MSAALSAPAGLAPTRCAVCRAELERMSKSALAPVETEMTSWEREASGRAPTSSPPSGGAGPEVSVCQQCWDVPCACGSRAGAAAGTPRSVTEAYERPRYDGRYDAQPEPEPAMLESSARTRRARAQPPPREAAAGRQPVAELCMNCMDTTCRCVGGTPSTALCSKCFDVPCACR